MIVRKTTAAEAPRINEIFSIAFETPLTNCPADPGNSRIHHWAAFEDSSGEMMSSLTISDFQIQFDGHSCVMGGIGGVSTLPQYRRKGGIRGCFEAALPHMYAAGYDFSYLYPFSTGYYRKFGYESCVQKYHWTLNLGLLNLPPAMGHFRMAEKGKSLTDAIQAVDAVWEASFNMMVQHRTGDYEWAENSDPARKQEFTYIWFDSHDTPKAYTTFRPADQSDGRNLNCSRFCFLDREGFYGLLHIFKSLSADHRFAKFTTPAIPAMQYLMPEWSLGAAQWAVQPAGMVRVVNVQSVLQKAKYLGSGSITIGIQDLQIRENNRTYTVAFTDGHAVSVIPTQDAPDVIMPVSTFSALIAGVCDFAEAVQWVSGLEVKNAQACFSQVFYRKKLMISDYF